MRTLHKTMTVLSLVAVLVLATVGTALAAEPDPATPPDLDDLKARVTAQADARIARFEDRLADLEGREGPMAVQLTALFTQGIADLEELKEEVAAATTAAEIRQAVRETTVEFAAHARIRTLYAHTQNDLARFEHRLDMLEAAITRAADAGFDTTDARAAADAARADLDAAAALLDGVDPGALGDGTLAQVQAAHRRAHAAQRHIRDGFRDLAAGIL
jgi:hypothetical protein